MKISNGSDTRLDEQCESCFLRTDPCPIALAHLEYAYEACGDEKINKVLEILIPEKTGRCKMKRLIT